jgi:hypothetical protein
MSNEPALRRRLFFAATQLTQVAQAADPVKIGFLVKQAWEPWFQHECGTPSRPPRKRLYPGLFVGPDEVAPQGATC